MQKLFLNLLHNPMQWWVFTVYRRRGPSWRPGSSPPPPAGAVEPHDVQQSSHRQLPALRHGHDGQPGSSHQSPHPPSQGEPAGEEGWKPGQWNLKLTQSDDKVFPLELDLSHPSWHSCRYDQLKYFNSERSPPSSHLPEKTFVISYVVLRINIVKLLSNITCSVTWAVWAVPCDKELMSYRLGQY